MTTANRFERVIPFVAGTYGSEKNGARKAALQESLGSRQQVLFPEGMAVRVSVWFSLHADHIVLRGKHKGPDVDNLCKLLLDALVAAKVIQDDVQISELHCRRLQVDDDVPEETRVHVEQTAGPDVEWIERVRASLEPDDATSKPAKDAILSKGDAALGPLSRIADDESIDVSTRMQALRMLFFSFSGQKAVEAGFSAVREALRDAVPEMRARIASLLGSLQRPEARQLLSRLAKDQDPRVRIVASGGVEAVQASRPSRTRTPQAESKTSALSRQAQGETGEMGRSCKPPVGPRVSAETIGQYLRLEALVLDVPPTERHESTVGYSDIWLRLRDSKRELRARLPDYEAEQLSAGIVGTFAGKLDVILRDPEHPDFEYILIVDKWKVHDDTQAEVRSYLAEKSETEVTKVERHIAEWQRLRTAVFLRDRHTCRGCGRVEPPLDVHHIVPLAQGGTSNLDNLVLLCEDCHRKAHR